MLEPAIEQEFTDVSTSVEVVRESIKNGDQEMMRVALKDVRKRVNRILKAIDPPAKRTVDPGLPVDPQLPTEPPSPIKDGQV